MGLFFLSACTTKAFMGLNSIPLLGVVSSSLLVNGNEYTPTYVSISTKNAR